MKKNIIALIFLCLISYNNYGQNLKKGSIITLKKNTIKGWIDYEFTRQTPTSISFHTQKEAKAQVFDMNTIMGFQVFNNNNQLERYETATVTIDTVPNTGTFLDNSPQMRTKEGKVFLQVLTNGKIDLLYLKDKKNKEHFFYRTENENIILLFYKVYYSTKRVSVEQYKVQLKKLLNNTITTKKIDKTLYKKRGLTQLIHQYNEAVYPNLANYTMKYEQMKPRFSIIAGSFAYKVNFLETEKTSLSNKYFVVKSAFAPKINFQGGIGMNLNIPKTNGKVSFYNEAAYANYTSVGHYTHETSSYITNIKMSYIKLNTLVKYQFWKGNNNLSQDFQIGFSSGFLLTKSFTQTLIPVTGIGRTYDLFLEDQYREFIPAFLAGTSISWNDKVSFHLRYELTNGFVFTNTLTTREQSLFLLVGYAF